MKNKLKKGFIAMCLAAPLVLGCASLAHAQQGKSFEIKKEYETNIKEENGIAHFNDVLKKDGLSYHLKSVEINRIEEIDSGDMITYESPSFVGDPDQYIPEEVIEKDGKKYTLKKSELIEVTTDETTKHSETSILYKGVEAIDPIPEDAEVKVTNEDLKQELSVRLPVVDYEAEKTYWDSNFTFPITVTDYDADTYLLGDVEISKNSPLIDHAGQLLDYLHLPSKYYEITRIEWDGEPVLKNGEMIRKATAYGRKLVKDIRGIYGGDVTFPSIKAKEYQCTYIEAGAENQTGQILYKKEATATYEQDSGKNGFVDVIKWIIQNQVTLSILLLLLLFVIVMLIIAKKKKNKKEQKQKEEKEMEEEEDEEI